MFSPEDSNLTSSFKGRKRSQLSQSPSKKLQKEHQFAYFREVLTGSGISLKFNDQPNSISQEQSLVIRDVNKSLRAHITYPNNAREFMTGLKTLCHKEMYLRKALMPTDLKKMDDLIVVDSNSKVQQESLIKMLLNIPCLQNDIIEMLSEHVVNYASEEGEDTTWLRLLLNPLRYLSHINEPKTLTIKLSDTLEVATYTAQLEILNLIPEIIPDSEYEEMAKQLIKLLDSNLELTAAIIDCLNSLNLSSNVRSEVQGHVLMRLESNSCAKMFPILFEFLIMDCNIKNISNVLLHARNAIDMIMASENNSKNVTSNKVLIFNRLQAFAVARRTLCEGWINVITNVRVPADQKPVDILILFMLHSIGNPRKSLIEGLIKKRIKLGLFRISLIESLFKKYFVTQILKDFLNSVIEIGKSLLRFYNEPILIDFASSLFKMLFSHELIDRIQRQDIIYNLILATGTSDKKGVLPILKVFAELLEDFETLQLHSEQLMGLLEKLDAVDLKDAKVIFDVLCSLTCGERADNSMSGLRDEIHMIVRKQLSSAKKIVKHRGIIAAVSMAKALASTLEDQSVSSIDESLRITDIANANSQDAAALLNLARTCTLGSPDSVGLYYDQLASMLTTTQNLDNQFLMWLSKLITNEFQNVFVIETIPSPINGIEVLMKYSLNTAEEVDIPIGVNIAELTLKSRYYESNSILTLAPLFRLLRLIHFREFNKDLSGIDALLGCAVLMPNIDDIHVYDTEQLKNVSDCIFHCINWFREVISAFVTQKNRRLRQKVLERLSDVVAQEELLGKCLESIPEHKLPSSYYFDIMSQTTKQLSPPTKKTNPVKHTRKKQKICDTTMNAEDSIASTSATAATQQTKTGGVSKKKARDLLKETGNIFREMDIDVILLLKYPIKLEGLSNNIASQLPSTLHSTCLDIKQFQFIMKDFVNKLEVLSKNKNLGFSHMTLLNLDDLIMGSIRLFPHFKKHMNVITGNIEALLNESGGCLDAKQMFTSEANNLKSSFSLIIKSLNLIFNWPGFQYTKNLNLLKDCLKAFRDDTQSQMISVKGLSLEFVSKLLSYVNCCLYLPSAVDLVQIIQALYLITSHTELQKKKTVLSEKLLRKRWYNVCGNLEMGKSASLHTDILVKAYLNGANVKTICGLVGTLQDQVSSLKAKDDSLKMLPSINKMNFYIFYRCLCITLFEAVKTEINTLTNNQHLVLWRTISLTMQGLMTVVKAQETRTNLTSFLKYSLKILKIFLDSGMPILEIMLRSKTDEVIEIFKIMQTSTRFLHYLCCYSKYTKDTSLVAYVPQFRLLLESLLYRVKAALVANECSAAFWMGTLKNKNMHGEDILSQSSMQSDESEIINSDHEELPPDESEGEVVAPTPDEIEIISEGDSSASDIV